VVSRFQGLIDTIGQLFQIEVQQLGELDDGRRYSVVQVTARGAGQRRGRRGGTSAWC
jgi:hypothetical protein